MRLDEHGLGRDRDIAPGDPVAIEIRDNSIGMNRQFGGGLHAAGLQKNIRQQMADPGVSRAGKRADKIQLPSLPQETADLGGVVGLNRQAENRARPLAQQPGEMPEIARLEKDPKGRAKPAPEKSRIVNSPAALGSGILLACHILPHLIVKSVTLQWRMFCESGVGVMTPDP
jgi:hypothetical protein